MLEFEGLAERDFAVTIVRSVFGNRQVGTMSYSNPNQNSLEPVPVTRTPEERFNDFLQSRNMRHTEQRRLLLEFVFSQEKEGHFDADQLIEKMPKRGEPGYVSRPTVYRTLSEFVDAGLLRKFELDGRSVYEHDYGYPQHEHLYCTSCSGLFEFQSDKLKSIIEEVAESHQFHAQTHRFIIRGICESCRLKKRRTRRRVDRI